MGGVITSFLVLVLFGGWIYYQQPAMVFYPVQTMSEDPSDWGLQYEDVKLSTDDNIRLHGWYISHPDADRVILFFHGNAGNISHRQKSIEIFHNLGLSIFIVNYRGYGKSEGTPSELGFYKDSRVAWNYLLTEKGVNKKNIIIFGRSLGGVVATELASEVQPGYLILESTFSSAKDMAKKIFPIMSTFIPLRFEFNAIEYIKKVKSPLLVAHSPDDEIIPYQLGEKLFLAANEPKVFLQLTGGHNGGFLMSQPDYEQQIGQFLTKQAIND